METKRAEKEALAKRDQARTILRMCKERGSCITKDSAKVLFAEAQWPYDPDSPYLKIPEEDEQ
jgi:hypothetical protein